jgi:hypothetical protein
MFRFWYVVQRNIWQPCVALVGKYFCPSNVSIRPFHFREKAEAHAGRKCATVVTKTLVGEKSPLASAEVARFFLGTIYLNGKKYTKYLCTKIPIVHKLDQHFPFQRPRKFTQIEIFGFSNLPSGSPGISHPIFPERRLSGNKSFT